MLFNSFEFLCFFPIVTLLFFILPHKFRWMLLLAASCFFYMFFRPIYILILAFTIVIDYYAGILIESANTPKGKHRYLLLSLFANIGVLAVFKYYNFLGGNINAVFSLWGSTFHIPFLHILLPIGLSFHTFQAMSYTLEVYYGNQKAERHFGIYALYVMFYPQLVAGPIERPQNMLPQFHEKQTFDYDRMVSGLQLMLIGLFKKVVIADRLAQIVDPRFLHPHDQTAIGLTIASIFYGFQIYCDFSGYSDIAIGSAKVMGFTLMQNFNFPFVARNITEFWRRWHISLLTWFNDYLFKPFVIAKRSWGKWAVVAGLVLTFSISGLWHGAAWTFVAWGLLHGIAMIFEYLTKKTRSRISRKAPPLIYNSISHVLTFSFLILTWICFRSRNFSDAWYITKQVPHAFSGLSMASIKSELFIEGTMHYEILLSFFFIFGAILFHGTRYYYWMVNNFNKQTVFIRWSVYIGMIITIIVFGVFGNKQFIYFQF